MSDKETKSRSDDDNTLVYYLAGCFVIAAFTLWMIWDEGKRADESAERHKSAGHRYIKFSGNKYGSWCTYSATTGQWTPVIEHIE